VPTVGSQLMCSRIQDVFLTRFIVIELLFETMTQVPLVSILASFCSSDSQHRPAGGAKAVAARHAIEINGHMISSNRSP